jgi:hypothetical protein
MRRGEGRRGERRRGELHVLLYRRNNTVFILIFAIEYST